jgi:hypothetical protein
MTGGTGMSDHPSQDDKNIRTKAIATTIIWLTYLVMTFVGISMLEAWGVALAFVLMIPIILIAIAMWVPDALRDGDKDSEKSATIGFTIGNEVDEEKRKRDRLTEVLQRLSDEELHALRDGIRDGRIDDVRIQDMLADDGEFIQNLR